MFNIAIIEDEPAAARLLSGYINEYGATRNEQFNISVFSGAVKFLENYRGDYDIVFMDIELPDMNGMDASRRLREIDKDVLLVFVTNMAQCAVSGYDVGAFSFIVKPVSRQNFVMKFERAIERLKNRTDATVCIHGKTGAKRINTADLKYVEIQGHNIVWHLTDRELRSTGTLKSVKAQLGNTFVSCNQCYLVNLRYCREVDGDSVDVGGEKLHISRPKRAEFVRALNLYINGD